jgi:hypothetical protein
MWISGSRNVGFGTANSSSSGTETGQKSPDGLRGSAQWADPPEAQITDRDRPTPTLASGSFYGTKSGE